jgi:hypothetical protein
MFVFYARLFDSINSTIAKYFFEDRQENSLLQLKDRFLDAMNNADFGTSKTIRDAYIHAVLCLNNYGGTSTKDTSCLKSVIDANRSLYTKISRDSPANADKYIKLNEIYLHNVETSNALLDYKTYSQPINA